MFKARFSFMISLNYMRVSQNTSKDLVDLAEKHSRQYSAQAVPQLFPMTLSQDAEKGQHVVLKDVKDVWLGKERSIGDLGTTRLVYWYRQTKQLHLLNRFVPLKKLQTLLWSNKKDVLGATSHHLDFHSLVLTVRGEEDA